MFCKLTQGLDKVCSRTENYHRLAGQLRAAESCRLAGEHRGAFSSREFPPEIKTEDDSVSDVCLNGKTKFTTYFCIVMFCVCSPASRWPTKKESVQL